ncbi:MAG: glycosyltransferase [Candidatus Aenigmarchaeota archaeon]|nr:glycosyltransferase [Candidatus Aenigmarchaeota archaeon]
MGKIKIMHIAKGFPPDMGGIESYTYELANAFKNKYDVHVLTTHSKLSSSNEIDGIKVTRVKKIFDFLHAPINLPFFNKINQINPEIIHFHIPNPLSELYLLFYLMFKKNQKVIATYHADIPDYTPLHKAIIFLRQFYMHFLMKFFDAVIVTSDDYISESKILEKFNERLKVIPIGVDTDLKTFSVNKLKKQYKIKNEKIVLFVGRLFPYKGIEYLISAIPMIIKHYPDVRFAIVGGGEKEAELKKLAENLKIDDKVIFTGKVDNKTRNTFYKICDVFVLPSINRGEAFGISLLEAMSFGKPLITTRIKGSGVNFINKHPTTGLVVEPADSNQLALAITRLLTNDELRERMGRNSKKRFLKFFTKDIMLSTTEKLYKTVLNKGVLNEKNT